jgi:hypothetical protein
MNELALVAWALPASFLGTTVARDDERRSAKPLPALHLPEELSKGFEAHEVVPAREDVDVG